jgi:hypothetical protein
MTRRPDYSRRVGGLALYAQRMPYRLSAPQLPAGVREVSHLAGLHAGDDQGEEGACAIFAAASLAEWRYRVPISSRRRLSLYAQTLDRLGLPAGSGLTVPQAFDACQRAGWIEPGARVRWAVPGDLLRQPLIVAVRINRVLDNPSPEGCADHADAAVRSASRGYHAMLRVAYGVVDGFPAEVGPLYVEENSWGTGYGWRGLVAWQERVADAITVEQWAAVWPDEPAGKAKT